MKKFTLLLFLLAFQVAMFGQMPSGGNNGNMGAMMKNMKDMKIGRFYGKVIDSRTKKPVEFASVVLLWFNKDSLIAGGLAKENGDFSLDNLPPYGGYRLRITFLGYKTYETKVYISPPNKIDNDLGDIKLEPDEKMLKEVEVTTEKSTYTMGIDRKIYNVDKDISTRGGTGLDAVKNIPSITVDADGGVQLRNNSVQIYIDGRPSTLSLQQIPADQIERVEIITNPSVKFDAATTGGILNVVLKKNTKPGYNGMVMAGIGTGDRYNGMGNLNVKEGKFNVSMMYNYNTSTNNNDGFTNRNSITLPPANPFTNQISKYYYQTDTNRMKNTFQFARLAVDYYINNRNTITVSGNYVHGQFKSSDNQHYRYNDVSDVFILGGQRVNVSSTQFDNYTGQIQYKKTFPKQGKEFTTDITINGGSSNTTYTYTTYQSPFPPINQRSEGGTPSWMYTYQADYVNPINDHSKLEAGVRSFLNRSFSTQKTFNDSSGTYVTQSDLTNNYNITNMTNAAYINYSSKIFEINYQAGLRFEQSYYKGNITNKDISFSYSYPSNTLNNLQYSLFPAIYLTKKLPKNQELQVNFSRKINRPNFFQLMPFVMFSDNANIRIGNPQLKPEFINLSEINYNITSSNGKINYLVSAYFRYIENPITNVAYPELSNPNVLVNTFQNGRNSLVGGLDNTIKVTPFKNFDVTLNANTFYTTINYLSGSQLILNSGYSWTGKAGLSYKFPADFGLQVNGNYQAPQILPQGRTREVYYMDITASKSIKQKLTFTLLLSDVFNSKRMGTNYNTPDYIQQLSRRRETRYLRLSVTYLFGKLDSSIFKRRPPKGGQNGMGNADGLDF